MHLNPRRLRVGLALAAVAALAACDSDGGSTSSTIPQDYYDGNESAALGAAGNEATCATCHSNRAGVTGDPGDTLRNIAFRTSFKGGGAATLRDASNACITGWMGGEALAEGDEAWTQLETYLKSISDPAVTEPNSLAPEVLADEAAYEAAYAGGDATAGASAYAQSCARCHSGGLKLGGTSTPSKAVLALNTVGRIAQQVRTSGPPPSGTSDASDTTPGPMPFFEPDELSQDELRDIIAYIKGE
ncbi:MAG: cytochrome c [Deltaproteobacteria bacterium]|nr:MAG: cytochrome c [Deltaproteobacteria bacterium]